MKLFKKKEKSWFEEEVKKLPRKRRKKALKLMEEYRAGIVLVPGVKGGLKKYGQVSQQLQE